MDREKKRTVKKTWKIAVLILAAAVFLSACVGKQASDGAAPAQNEKDGEAAAQLSPVQENDAQEGDAQEASDIDYSDPDNWAYLGVGNGDKADVFLICPTVDVNEEDFNMSVDDEELRGKFLNALEMERGIYEEENLLYAPYYGQMAMQVYSRDPSEWEPYLKKAYQDVSASFRWYLEEKNNDRPIILAGFSQGADMCYRLLEEYFDDEELYDSLVAVYAIGWHCTDEMVRQYPQIVPASRETDTGVVISFDCEAPELSETFICPAGEKGYAINPLNWKTDSTPADKSENLGACFMKGNEITQETAQFCGCYIDEERGVLKVPGLDVETYSTQLAVFPTGAYHIYDYQFFYRNLQQNVKDRVEAFLSDGKKEAK